MNNGIKGNDVEAAINSKIISGDSNLDAFNKTSTLIDNFCNSPNLQGEVWEKVRLKMQEYNTSLTEGITIINDFIEVVKAELTKLKNALGDGTDMIDISRELEIHDLIERLKSQIANLTYNLNNSERASISNQESGSDEKSNNHFIANLRKQINDLQYQLNEAEKSYELIVRVKLAYENAQKAIDDAYLRVAQYAENGIMQPDGKYIYNS